MRFKMVSLITGMALVCAAGSVLAASTIYVSGSNMQNEQRWNVDGSGAVDLGVQSYSIDMFAGSGVVSSGTKRGRAQYTETGSPWVKTPATSSPVGQSWIIAEDQAGTGTAYSVAESGRVTRYAGSTVAAAVAATSGVSTNGRGNTGGIYAEDQAVADAQVFGNYIYFTVGKGNNEGFELYGINKNFSAGDAVTTLFTWDAHGNHEGVLGGGSWAGIGVDSNGFSGLAIDANGLAYVGFLTSNQFGISTVQLNGLSTKVKADFNEGWYVGQNDSAMRDIDIINGKVYAAVGNGIKVFNQGGTSAVLDSTFLNQGFGGNAVFMASDAPVPEPSSIFGLLVGGTSLFGLLRRRAR